MNLMRSEVTKKTTFVLQCNKLIGGFGISCSWYEAFRNKHMKKEKNFISPNMDGDELRRFILGIRDGEKYKVTFEKVD